MRATVLLCLLILAAVLRAAVPLAAYYPMESVDGGRLVDAGPLGYHGTVTGATVVDGHAGKALHFDHAGKAIINTRGMLDKLSDAVTLTFWVKIDAFPTHDHVTYLVKKRPTFSFGVGDNRLLAFDAYKGSDWYTGDWCGKVPGARGRTWPSRSKRAGSG